MLDTVSCTGLLREHLTASILPTPLVSDYPNCVTGIAPEISITENRSKVHTRAAFFT